MRRAALLLAPMFAAIVLVTADLPAQEMGTRTPIADLEPLPPAAEAQVSPETIALRAELLGPRALDPNYVTLQWYGVASFLVTIRGHLLLFDAWEIVGLNKDYVPIGREELALLDPEAILIGHGHFDHAADAGYVAGRSGALVVGSEEICDTAQADAAADGLTADCAITGTMSEPAPGTAQTFSLFADVEPVTVLQHIHSAATPPGDGNEPGPQLPVFDPTPYIENPNLDPEELARFIATLDDRQGGTWMYHFRVGDFTLLLGDSAGPIFSSPEVTAALDAFPGCVDVMANAILGFDQPISGLQDPRLYIDAVRPRVFLPQHGDAWAPVLSAGQAQYVPLLHAELRRIDAPPEVDFLLDPEDYLAERAYRVDDPRWREPMPRSSCDTTVVDRRDGPDRFATAARLSSSRFQPGDDVVYLASGSDYPDALTAGVIAARDEGPVLLVEPGALPASTATELERIRPTEVVVAGGDAAVAEAVLTAAGEAAHAATVTRVAGADRYATAAALSQRGFPDGAATAVIATGTEFADALAGAPFAATSTAPLLLVAPDAVPQATADELLRLAPEEIVLLGGVDAVSDAVAAALAELATVRRIGGADRYATAAEIAATFGEGDLAYVASGEAFADATATGAVAGFERAPLLLTARESLPAATAAALTARAPSRVVVAGGESAISNVIAAAVEELSSGV